MQYARHRGVEEFMTVQSSSCWLVPESEFRNLTAPRARDLIVECFFQAQHETFHRAKQRLGSRAFDDQAIRSAIVGAVRVAFREAGGDFDRPTPDMLAKIVGVLARKAEAWGTPEDVVAHHTAQVERLLVALGVRPRRERT
jgi:hypothetical protein